MQSLQDFELAGFLMASTRKGTEEAECGFWSCAEPGQEVPVGRICAKIPKFRLAPSFQADARGGKAADETFHHAGDVSEHLMGRCWSSPLLWIHGHRETLSTAAPAGD